VTLPTAEELAGVYETAADAVPFRGTAKRIYEQERHFAGVLAVARAAEQAAEARGRAALRAEIEAVPVKELAEAADVPWCQHCGEGPSGTMDDGSPGCVECEAECVYECEDERSERRAEAVRKALLYLVPAVSP
jgi:hypothetical protein